LADHAPKTHGRGYEDGAAEDHQEKELSIHFTQKKELSKWLPYSISLTSSWIRRRGKCFHEYHSGRLIKEDKYQDGVPIANIPYDPLEIQTESEVLGELTDQKISEMGQSVLKHFQSLELEYYNQGQQYQKNRRFDMAIEKYVDCRL